MRLKTLPGRNGLAYFADKVRAYLNGATFIWPNVDYWPHPQILDQDGNVFQVEKV
jgi:hypothetical protein